MKIRISLFTLALAMSAAIPVEAQSHHAGTNFSHEISAGYVKGIGTGKASGAFLEATVGHTLADGLFLGAGTGAREWNYSVYPEKNSSFFLPVFGDIRYTVPLKSATRPFIDVRGGFLADITNAGVGRFIRPSVGVRYNNLGISVGAEVMMCKYITETQTMTGDVNVMGNPVYSTSYSGTDRGKNSVFLSVSYSF